MQTSHGASGAPLTILSIAYPLLPVGPGSGGGAEQILHLLEQGLVRAGFRSIVVAAAGSTVAGELMATPAASETISGSLQKEAQHIHAQKIEAALSCNRIDLLHFHGLDFRSYRPQRAQPRQLATLHLPIDWYPPGLFDQENLSFNFVSRSQAASDPGLHPCPVVPNGVDLRRFHAAEIKHDYVLWLGRICPEKGTDIALRVAHRLGLSMVVAGPVHPFPSHRQYFANQVEPLLDDQRRYAGPVNMDDKANLLAHARCLLVPSLASETSSLVAMEAISSGTPVIAFRSGALPEIVEDGRTGFVVDSEEEMGAAVLKTSQISGPVCRKSAEARFSTDRMVAGYIDLYRELLSTAPEHA